MNSNEKKNIEQELVRIEEEITKLRKKRIELNSQLAEQEVNDYVFKGKNGDEKKLSEMFNGKKYLFLIHNMGKGCSYCTMWADGFNSIFPYLEKKGAFVLISPNDPATQKQFSESRGWKFDMYSDQGNTFTKDVGFLGKEGGHWPGVSVFEKTQDGKIKRVAKDFFGPGDFFCSVWHFYDLLPDENITVNS